MPLKIAKSTEPRRLSKFSAIPRTSKEGIEFDDPVDKAKLAALQGKLEKYTVEDSASEEVQIAMESDSSAASKEMEVAERRRQRKGAIADEGEHKLLAKDAVVSETLRVSGLGRD